MPSLLYATPTGRHPHIAFVQCMRAMELGIRSFGERRAEDFAFMCGPVQMARTAIAQATLAGKCNMSHRHDENDGAGCKIEPYDFVLMHDDDLMVDPISTLGNPIDAWHKLFNEYPDVGVIGAVYLREKPQIPNIVVKHPTNAEEVCHAVAGFPNQPFEVAGIATGFMMVRREVFEALYEIEDAQGAPPMFKFGVRKLESGIAVEDGEDYDFCRRVREAGFRIVADPRFSTVHLKDSGPLRYERDQWEHSWDAEKNPGEAEMRAKQLRAHLQPLLKLAIMNGMVVIDHTEQRAADIAAWQARVAARAGSKAVTPQYLPSERKVG